MPCEHWRCSTAPLEAEFDALVKVEVLERLREIGVDFAKGFSIHRPAPIQELLVTGNVERSFRLDPVSPTRPMGP